MSRILIVEDEDIIRRSISRLLEREGHETLEADCVTAALSLGLGSFDLIISDLRLPGASGDTLIEQAAPVPVLIMTSYASLKSAVDSMKQGARDYIAKPFDHEEMLAAVRGVLAQSLVNEGGGSEQSSLSLNDYFQRFVIEHQASMTETQLAEALGISRKTLWERRQKLGIPRQRNKQS